ncbi:MAG: hypothetical protein RTV31_02830 [Candidatus Thorarchaeota archaeon]
MNEETGYKWTKTDFCSVIGAVVILGIGILFSNFIINSMPELPGEPGYFGPPMILLYMPAIMCSIPLIICIYMMATANKRAQAIGEISTVHRYRDETLVYTGDYQLDSKPESKEPEKVYLIPAECPSCQSPLNADVVDWVGPLKAKCPHCGAIVEAKEKTF